MLAFSSFVGTKYTQAGYITLLNNDVISQPNDYKQIFFYFSIGKLYYLQSKYFILK